MKKNKWLGLAFIAIMTSFSACNNDAEEMLTQESEIKLTSEITPTSRVASLDYQSKQIVEGQQVGVTITGAKSEHKNVAWTVEANGTLTNNGDAIYYGSNQATIIAYHPYNQAWTGESVNEAFSVALDQSTNFGYLNSDLLWATASSTKTTDAVNLLFTHQLAKINITLTSTDVPDLSNAIISICGTNTYTYFNPITGALSAHPSPKIQTIKAAVTTGTTYTASAIIIPQTVTSGTKFIKVEHNGKTYYYTLSSDVTFTGETSYDYKLTVTSSTELTLSSSSSDNITEWTPNEDIEEGEAEEVLQKSVTLQNAGTLSDYISNEEKLQVENLKITGNLNGADISLIREMAGNDGKLTLLDLSNANIVAGIATYYDNYTTENNTIGEMMFSGLGLESLILPASTTSIGVSAFFGCALTTLIIPEGVTTIADYAFTNCENMTFISIPSTVTSINGNYFLSSDHLNIDVAENNSNYTSDEGILYTKDKTELVRYSLAASISTFVIPNSVTVIAENALEGSPLTSLTIPNSVTTINSLPSSPTCKIHCQIEEPITPTITGIGYPNFNAILYVPSKSLEKYKAHDFWKQFTTIKSE